MSNVMDVLGLALAAAPDTMDNLVQRLIDMGLQLFNSVQQAFTLGLTDGGAQGMGVIGPVVVVLAVILALRIFRVLGLLLTLSGAALIVLGFLFVVQGHADLSTLIPKLTPS